MRSKVQKLFHVLRSTAEGIQPIKATTKAMPEGVRQSQGSGAAVTGGGERTVNPTAVTVETSKMPASNLMNYFARTR